MGCRNRREVLREYICGGNDANDDGLTIGRVLLMVNVDPGTVEDLLLTILSIITAIRHRALVAPAGSPAKEVSFDKRAEYLLSLGRISSALRSCMTAS